MSDSEIKIAFLGSIKKWERIVAGEIDDGGSSDCPLCQIFPGCCSSEDSWISCVDVEGVEYCPIYFKTTSPGCLGTPYKAWTSYFSDVEYENAWLVHNTVTKRLAQNMLDFLVNLYEELYGAVKNDQS
jgi:hypothetical protein